MLFLFGELLSVCPPLHPQCNTELHANYGGASVELGLTQEFAVVCCQACLDEAKNAKSGE